MRLTAEQYERGVVSWDAEVPPGAAIEPQTATWDGSPPAEPEWSSPYTDPNGSVVTSPVRQYGQLRISMRNSDPHTTPILRGIRWERPDGVQIGVAFRTPTFVRVARCAGFACRWILKPRAASWTMPQVFLDMANEVRVRFIQGKVRGTQLQPFDRFEVGENGEISLAGGGSAVVEAEGQFLEVHATVDEPGMSFDDGIAKATANCQAVLGMLALICGEQVVGEPVLQDQVETRPDAEYGADRIPVSARFPRIVDEQQYEAIERSLHWPTGYMRDDRRMARGLHLAFRWYLRAVSSDSPFDQFTSCFMALETLASSYNADRAPAEERAEAAAFKALVEAATAAGFSPDPRMCAQVNGLFGDIPLGAKFARLRDSLEPKLGDSGSDVNVFRTIRAVRNHVLHGEQTDVTHQEASDARTLLERILGALIDVPLPQPVPTFWSTKLDFTWGTPQS
ncbi:MAG: hypothetical protein ACYDAG_03210 [Chloroflexota bacterium]